MCVADELKKALKVYSFELFAIQIKTINLTLVRNEQFCHLYQTLLWLANNDTYKNSCNFGIETDINVIQISSYSLQ